MRIEKRVLQNNAVQKGKIMAKKTNIVNDDNIGNFKHERRNELPLERFKQTAGNEVANSILDAYDNARDRKADNRQQEQRIRDYQQEREKTGRNSEQLHFQRNYDVYDAGFDRNSGENAPMQQSYSENTSRQPYNNTSYNSNQYTGSARTDSAKPSSRVSSETESRVPVSDAGSRYTNPTIDNSSLNAMSSEGQRLSHAETPSYETPRRTSLAQGVRGGGNISGGNYVPPHMPESSYSIDRNGSQIIGADEKVPMYNIGDKHFNTAKEQRNYFKANKNDILNQVKGETGSFAINGRVYSNINNVNDLDSIINKSASERYAVHKVAVQTPNGIVMVDAADKKKAEMDAYYDDMMNRKQAERVTAQLNAVSQRISSPNRIHVGEDVGGTRPKASRVQIGYNAGNVNASGGGIGGNSRTENPALENNRFGVTDGTEPDTMDINHNPNTVINPKPGMMPVDITAPVKVTFKQSDTYQGYKKLKTVRNTFRGSGNRQAAGALKAYGFERTKGVGIKKDIQNKLALNERSLNMLAVNVANIDVSRINQMLKTGMFNGQRLTNDQLKLLSERADLLKARNEINSRQGYNLLNVAIDNTFMQADVVQGARMAKTAGRITGKGANIALSAPTATVSKIASGTARMVGSDRLGKFGQVVGDFSSSSLTGKVKMVSKGSAKVVGKGAKATERATIRVVGRTSAGQAAGRAVVRAKTGLNSARVRVVGGLNGGRARVVNSKAGRAVSGITNRMTGVGRGISAGISRLGTRIGNNRFVQGTRRFAGRIGAVNRARIRVKSNIKNKINNMIKSVTTKLRYAALGIMLLIVLITCVPTAFMSVVSAQGSTTSSNSKTDEPALMQQVVSDMYKIQTSVEDDLRDGSGGSGIKPESVNVTYNGSHLDGGLSTIGLSSAMNGVANMTTDGLNIKYTGCAERIQTIKTEENWTEYTKTDNVSKTLMVKTDKLEKYKKKDTKKNKKKNVKIYYKDLCTTDEGNPDFVSSCKTPATISEDAKSYTPEGKFNKNSYFLVKGEELATLELKRWTIEVSGGAPTGTPKSKTIITYKPTGIYSYETVYGPANSDGKLADTYQVPKYVNGAYRVYPSFKAPDPEISLKFQDENGNIVSPNQLYKAVCATASAGTHNTVTDKQYYEDWCNYLMMWMLNKGHVNIEIKTEDDTSTKFGWYGYDDADIMPCNGNEVTGTDANKYRSLQKGDRLFYFDTGKKLTVSVDYVVDTSFEEILKKGDKIDFEWQKSHSTEKCPWKEKTWKGFHNSDGTLNDTGESAKAWYEMDDSAYEDMGVIFPGNTYPVLSSAKIDDYINQIKTSNGGSLSAQRESVIRAGLQYVGRFVYVYAGGHGSYPSKETAAATVGNSGGVDCSGFVSFVTNQGGVFHHSGDTGYTAQGACDFAHFGKATSKGALKPGDIVVKNAEAGGSTTSNNHVVIYGGKFDTGDGAGVIDRFIECTTTNNLVDGQEIQECSGSQITKQSRSTYILSKYIYYRNPYGD